MTDYSNWQVEKSVIDYIGFDAEKQAAAEQAQAEYTAAAEWCNESGQYTIIEDEDGELYKVVKLDKNEVENA